MKKLGLLILLLTILSAVAPTFAQRVNILKSNGLLIKKMPVSYASAEAFSDGRGVWLQWKTEREAKNLGFFVYRIVGDERQLVSPALIGGKGLLDRSDRTDGGSYSFFDRSGDVNSRYVIENVNANGLRYNSDFIQTQYIDDLTKVAGASSEEFINQLRTANPIAQGSESVLPKDLAEEVGNYAQSPDPVMQRWVAAQSGVKIGVKTDGFYRVSRADLQANGFDVTQPSERWQLYVNGVEQAINVGANGSYIEFYGKAIEALESDVQTYFLVVGASSGKRIGTTTRRRISASVLSDGYSQLFYKKERMIYNQNILNGDGENFFGTFIANSTVGINFNITGVNFNSSTASIDVTLQGGTTVPHQTRVILNDVVLGEMSGNGYDLMTKNFVVQTSILLEGANVLKLQTLDSASDISFFSSMKVNFARKYVADQNRLSFYTPNYKASYAENFSSPNVRVFDLTNADAPLLITGLNVESSNGTYRVYLPSNRGRVMYAVEDSGLSQPFSLKPNNPSTLSTAANNGELIIISYKDWMTEAENWANYRRAQGMNVKVVDVDDIYDEFNYGVLSADSIRSFLNYAKNNWTTKPNYVLMIGDATFDPKNYVGGINYNFVPTRMVDTIYTETCSDDTLADFNNDGLAEIPIGRLPVRDGATVTMLLNKVTVFEQNLGTGSNQGINRGALFASDLPDGYDFEGLSSRIAAQLPAGVPRTAVNRGLTNAQTLLTEQLNSGKFVVNYSGHGNVGVWAANSFFNTTMTGQLTNGGEKLSIFTMLTCLNGYFIQQTDSLSEGLLKNPNGGAVTVWASTGLTTPDIQEVMATRFYNQLGAGNITRLGPLINDAKTTINFGRDVRLSWVLLGDPTLKIK